MLEDLNCVSHRLRSKALVLILALWIVFRLIALIGPETWLFYLSRFYQCWSCSIDIRPKTRSFYLSRYWSCCLFPIPTSDGEFYWSCCLFPIPAFDGEFICERFIYFLLLMEDLFVKHFFHDKIFIAVSVFLSRLYFLIVPILFQFVSLWVQYRFRIGEECHILKSTIMFKRLI